MNSCGWKAACQAMSAGFHVKGLATSNSKAFTPWLLSEPNSAWTNLLLPSMVWLRFLIMASRLPWLVSNQTLYACYFRYFCYHATISESESGF